MVFMLKEKQLQIIERERRGKIIVIFAYPPKSVFQIAIADHSPLDQTDFWTADSTHVMLQIIWLDC